MVRSLKFQWASSPYVMHRDDGIRLRVEIICATGLSPKIFAYRLLPTALNETYGLFDHVCSPVDLADYPADAPLANVAPQWFRLNYVDVLLRSTHEAENLLQAIKDDMRRLLATLGRMDTLGTPGIGLLGPDCDPPDDPGDPDPPDPGSSLSFGTQTFVETTGTSEQNVGIGVPWETIGEGAGTPTVTNDNGSNSSRVTLPAFSTSKMLLVQGFDFSDIPDTAVIDGIELRVHLRDATSGQSPSDSVTTPNTGSVSLADTAPSLSFLTIQSPEMGQSANFADGTDISGPNWTILTRGDTDDLWGFDTITPAAIKDGAFGVGIGVTGHAIESVVAVDSVIMTVYYREVL